MGIDWKEIQVDRCVGKWPIDAVVRRAWISMFLSITFDSRLSLTWTRPVLKAGPIYAHGYRRNASCRPPSTVMTWPVVLLKRWLTSKKNASAWSAGVIGDRVNVRSA